MPIFDITPTGGTLLGSGSTPFDLDGDGDQDLAVFVLTINGGENFVRLLENTGGAFVTLPFPPNPNPGAFAAGDIDGDGDQDLASSGTANR
ncbi:MAG: FG-GAP-like repeat-containing protein [Planctomycetota bacterium]